MTNLPAYLDVNMNVPLSGDAKPVAYTPGTQVAVVYERGGSIGNRVVFIEREFDSVQAATNWITPYIMAGHPFDICSATYLNKKRAATA